MDHPAVAITVGNHGRVLRDLGDLGGARIAFEHALSVFREHHGAAHPHMQTAQRDLNALKAADM